MLKILLLVFDIVSIIISFFFVKLLWYSGTHTILNPWTTLLFLILTLLMIKYFYDLYNYLYYAQLGRIFFKLINVWAIAFIVYVLTGFITKFYFLTNSRGFIIGFFIVYLIFVLLFRLIIVPYLLYYYFKKPERRRGCLYVGSDEKFLFFKNFFNENSIVGLNIVNKPRDVKSIETKEILLYSENQDFGELYKEIQKWAVPGVSIHLATELLNELKLNWEWCKIENLPIITFKVNGEKGWQKILRRVLDIILSVVSLILLLPLLTAIAIAVKLDSAGPIIFKQKRYGKNGKEFILYKFRSMYNDVESELDRELEFKDFIQRKIVKGKVINTQRITNIGKILRRTSLDEFPQFLNVLRGDMTLIGPRPPIPYEVKYYKDWHKERLKVKPGISGLWQVNGRGCMPCDSSIFLDLLYILNRSITLDLRLLFQTIPAVILGKGAY